MKTVNLKTRARALTMLLLTAPLIGAAPAAAQSADCELMLLPKSEVAENGQPLDPKFINAGAFLDSLYDGTVEPAKTAQGLPIRAVMCPRAQLIPTLRDLPILQAGLPLSVSENFDDPQAGLLTIFDAGTEYRAEYSGPKLTPPMEKQLRDTLEIFNFQKLTQQ